jgi:hypothetical protein
MVRVDRTTSSAVERPQRLIERLKGVSRAGPTQQQIERAYRGVASKFSSLTHKTPRSQNHEAWARWLFQTSQICPSPFGELTQVWWCQGKAKKKYYAVGLAAAIRAEQANSLDH